MTFSGFRVLSLVVVRLLSKGRSRAEVTRKQPGPSKETDEGVGEGEGGLGGEVVEDTSVVSESGEDTTAGADLLPLLVAGDGSVLSNEVVRCRCSENEECNS